MSQTVLENTLIQEKNETEYISFLSVESQHIFCKNCDSDVENVASLTFKITDIDGVKEFTLPPASSIELTQLAVLFGTSHAASRRLSFNTLPGFEISMIRNSDQAVQISFQADQEVLHFMGLSMSCECINTYVAIDDLEEIEASIRKSIIDCSN